MRELPKLFIESIQNILPNECEQLVSAINSEPPVSIRINRQKADKADISIPHEKVKWCDSGYYLSERPTFTFDPLFHAGCYYVQEASSMMIEQVVCQYVNKPVVALDLCASPGGKSTLLRSLLPFGSTLVCNEIIRNRANILAENIIKWGDIDVAVTNNSPRDFSSLTAMFDVVLADVPCSGEGMFRKDLNSVQEWSLENVDVCYNRQREIIDSIWHTLKTDGILIYSTCTYNMQENENNIDWILQNYDAESLPLHIEADWNITNSLHDNKDIFAYRFMPHKTRGEGFFISVIRKLSEEHSSDKGRKNKKQSKDKAKQVSKEQKQALEQAKSWIKPTALEDMHIYTEDNVIKACRKHSMEVLNVIKNNLKTLVCGLDLAEIKGKDLIPSHQLALSVGIMDDDCPPFYTQQLTYEEAIQYLRRENITPDNHTTKGYNMVSYKGKRLGFIKNIGNRANNLYPQEWKIRSGYIPDDVKTVM